MDRLPNKLTNEVFRKDERKKFSYKPKENPYVNRTHLETLITGMVEWRHKKEISFNFIQQIIHRHDRYVLTKFNENGGN